MSIKELDLEAKKVLKEAKTNHILWESVSKYNGVSTYSKALFYILDIKYYHNIFTKIATMLNLETRIPFVEAILEGEKALALYCNKEMVEGHTSWDYLACEGYAEIIRKRYLNNGVVISNE